MAYTIDQLNTLEAAIATAALTVRIGDRWITYQSKKDMIATRDEMRAELGIDIPTASRGRAKIFVTGHGL